MYRWGIIVKCSGEIHLASANREDNARLDISANGLWGDLIQERSMFDVRVFNRPTPHPTKASSDLVSIYKKHELLWEKKRAYGQRVREVEHASSLSFGVLINRLA